MYFTFQPQAHIYIHVVVECKYIHSSSEVQIWGTWTLVFLFYNNYNNNNLKKIVFVGAFQNIQGHFTIHNTQI